MSKSDDELLAGSEQLDRCCAEAGAFDAANQPVGPLDEEGYFDPDTDGSALAMMELRQAALDHKGRP